MSTSEPSDHPPTGHLVEGVVVAHHPWGIDLQLQSYGVTGTVERRYIDDDLERCNVSDYPPLGERRKAVVQGTTPWGQLRLTMRQAHVRAAEEEDEAEGG